MAICGVFSYVITFNPIWFSQQAYVRRTLHFVFMDVKNWDSGRIIFKARSPCSQALGLSLYGLPSKVTDCKCPSGINGTQLASPVVEPEGRGAAEAGPKVNVALLCTFVQGQPMVGGHSHVEGKALQERGRWRHQRNRRRRWGGLRPNSTSDGSGCCSWQPRALGLPLQVKQCSVFPEEDLLETRQQRFVTCSERIVTAR